MRDKSFIPDPERAGRLARALGAGLAGSIGELAETCRGFADLDGDALVRLADAVGRAKRVPPALYLRYHDALSAARGDDGRALAAALHSLLGVPLAAEGGAAGRFVRALDDGSWPAEDWARFRHRLGGAPGGVPPIVAPPPVATAVAAALLAEATRAIGAADPALGAEIDFLVGEVILAEPAPGATADLGGATLFEAWGAALLNVRRHTTLIAMAAGLVHEAAHALLMACAAGAPMVRNNPAERHASPLRPDGRSMDGVFHATFVSARIAYAMDRLLAGGGLDAAQAEEAMRRRNDSAAAFEAGHVVVAAHGRPTPAGEAAMAGALAYMRAGSAARAGEAFEAAEARYRAGDPAGAAVLLAPLADRTPCAPDVLRLLGLCQLRLGRPEAALGLLARAHAAAPADPWCALHHGLGLQACGRHGEAASLFRFCQARLPADPAPWLNLSTSLLALGDVQGAIGAARRGRARGSLPEAEYTLGVACLAAGQFSRATSCFRQAVRRAPRFVDGWINLGVAQYRAGQMEAAKQAMRTALAICPDHEGAVGNLASFMQLTGEGEASEALLTRFLSRRPGAAAARLNLAATLLAEDRSEVALALLAEPPPSGTTADAGRLAAHWRLQQALALLKLGRLSEARALLAAIGPVPPALAPLLHWRRMLLAEAEGDGAASRAEATAMRAGLEAAPDMLPEHRIMGHFDLAKHFSRHRDADQAFGHWAAGHDLLRRFQPFSRAAYAAFVDATIARFDTRRFAEGPRANATDSAPVFVVGMPRSGTTLTEQILSAHREVHGAGERPALGSMAERLGGSHESAALPGRLSALGQASLDEAAARYLDELHALAPRAARVIDKMPGNFRHLGLVGLMLPGARVIACDRDPRDIGLSIFTFRFYGAHAYAHDLSDLGWYIGQQRRLMAHWRAVLPNPILTVRLADWVEDFSGTLHRVLDFLDLPYDPACEHFYETDRRVRTVSRTQVKEKVNARGLGRWRAYERQLAPLIESLRQADALVGV